MAEPPLTAEAFAAQCGVSRETCDRLALYCELLRRWQRAVNLVGPKTLPDVWRRHIWDSAQLLPLLPPRPGPLLDVGSGAGFPGMVLAILGVEAVTLVESDARKGQFLREVARQTETPVTIYVDRLEKIRDYVTAPNFITARAVAPLPSLLDMVKLYIMPNTVCLFHKGRKADAELVAARAGWRFTARKIPSETDPTGVILRLEDIASA